MTRPDRPGFSAQERIRGSGVRTLSRISIRFSASAGLSGGEPLGDCSARNVVETMKGISCGSTPSFARSSGEIGGKSGKWLRLLVGCTYDARECASLCGTWVPADIQILQLGGGQREVRSKLLSIRRRLSNVFMSTPITCARGVAGYRAPVFNHIPSSCNHIRAHHWTSNDAPCAEFYVRNPTKANALPRTAVE